MVQLSHLYMTSGENIALIIQTFVHKVSVVFAFKYTVQVRHNFSSKEQVSFNFMTVVIICRDFGSQENKQKRAGLIFL